MAAVILTYGGIDITANVLFESARFEASVNGAPGPASFRIRDVAGDGTYGVGAEIVLTIDGDRAWAGIATQARRTYAFPALNLADFGPTRFWNIEAVDWNILFVRRVVFNQATPEDTYGTLFAAGTADTTAIAALIADFLDLSGDGIDTSSLVDNVGDITIGQKGRAWSAGDQWGQAMTSIARLPGAIFYIDPDKNLVYCDDDTASAPFGLSDQPNGTTFKGYREVEILKDGTSLANDVLAWGIGYGSQTPVFRRLQDSASLSEHGLWQTSSMAFGVYRQATIDYNASSILNGSPENRRGAKDDRLAVTLVTFEPGLRVAQKVDLRNEVFGFADIIPIRKMEITLPGPETPRYALTLSHDIDAPFSLIDNYFLPGFTFPSPFPPFPIGLPAIATCNDPGGSFIDTFSRTTTDTVQYQADLSNPDDRDLPEEVLALAQSDTGHQWYVRTVHNDGLFTLVQSHVNGTDVRVELDSTQDDIDDWEATVGNGGVSVVDYDDFDFTFTAVDAGYTMTTTVNLAYVTDGPAESTGYTAIAFVPTGNEYTNIFDITSLENGLVVYITNNAVRAYAQLFASGIGGNADDLLEVPSPAIINIKWQHAPPGISRAKVWFFPNTEPVDWTYQITSADATIPFYGSMAGFQMFVEHFDPSDNGSPNQVVTIPELLITKDYGCTQCENATEVTVAPFSITGDLSFPGTHERHQGSIFNILATINTPGACTASVTLDIAIPTGYNLGIINDLSDDHFLANHASGTGTFTTSLDTGGLWYVYAYNGNVYHPDLTGLGTYDFNGPGGDAGVWAVSVPFFPQTQTVFVDEVFTSDTVTLTPTTLQIFPPPDSDATVKACYLANISAMAGTPLNTYVCETQVSDGSAIITLNALFLPHSSALFVNGLRQRQLVDYTEDGPAGTVTLDEAPTALSNLRICYFALA